MIHIKGIRFGLPLLRRVGAMKRLGNRLVGWNMHDGIELHFVLKGRITWEFRGGRPPLATGGGCVAVVPPGVWHRAIDGNGAPAVRLGLILEPPAPGIAGGSTFSDADYAAAYACLLEGDGGVRRMSPRLLSQIREFHECIDLELLKTAGGRLHLRTVGSSVMDETVRVFSMEGSLSTEGDVIPKVADWIDAHCCEKIGMDQLVRLSGYARSHFFTLFMKETGMTPRDYIVRARIAAAKKLLVSGGGMPIGRLAASCGFACAASFSTIFRKHVGVPPSAFRKNRGC